MKTQYGSTLSYPALNAEPPKGGSLTILITIKKNSTMATTILTTEDLYDFKMQLFGELKKLLTENPKTTSKKYLKSAEVMEMLQVSPGTLQNLRINGTLPYTKIGGIILYEYDEILKVLKDNRVAS